MSTSLFECDKIGWIALCVIKYGEIQWVTDIVYNRIVQNVRLLSWFCRWYPHSTLSNRVFPGEDFTEVHSLVSLAVWFWVGVASRASSIHSKIYPFSIFRDCEFKNIIYWMKPSPILNLRNRLIKWIWEFY